MADPWDAEIEFSLERARELIESQYPELGPVRLASLGQGWDNLALLANEEWVFRFPQRDLARDLMAYETECLTRIAGRLPLAVPEPVFRGQPQGEYPYAFSGYRLLSGRTACRANLDDAARAASAEPLGRFLGELHAPSLAAELDGFVPGDLIRRTDLEYRVGQLHERLSLVEEAGEALDFDALRAASTELSTTEPWSGTPRLVHGDLYARHLIVDDRGHAAGVIDWGDTHLGDPALDLSMAFAFLPPAARGEFEAAYGALDEATRRRARFRALFSGAALVHYGRSTGDVAIAEAGRWALTHALL